MPDMIVQSRIRDLRVRAGAKSRDWIDCLERNIERLWKEHNELCSALRKIEEKNQRLTEDLKELGLILALWNRTE